MNKKYIILILIIILIIIGIGLLVSYNNQTFQDFINNYGQDNTTNNTNVTDDSTKNPNMINNKSSITNLKKSPKNKPNNSSEFTAADAFNTWKKLPHDPTEPEVIGSMPKYKDELGWYVPVRYKDDGEFIGCTVVASPHGPFFHYEGSYEDYKKFVSKKNSKKK
jgi:uncharacterized protein YxeA